MGAMSTHLLLA